VSIPDTTITLAELRPAGANPAPVGTIPWRSAESSASPSPPVQFEVWMPTGTGWNGKFQLVGNGGTAGVISYSAMRAALARGYATASTDTGHVSSGSFRLELGHSEGPTSSPTSGTAARTSLPRTASRSAAPSTASARVLLLRRLFKGGQQGLMEAQRYPEDFDGLIAGDRRTTGRASTPALTSGTRWPR